MSRSERNPSVDVFFTSGCGRCELFDTPRCKVHKFTDALALLREIILDCGFVEERKWGVPCYTIDGANVVLLGALNAACTLGFLQGALLCDTAKILTKPGENSQAARVLRFTTVDEVVQLESTLKAYLHEAIALTKSGAKVEFKKELEPLPDELKEAFMEDKALEKAFFALTPGRQRGYILHISQAKQAQTRRDRIAKWAPHIFAGKGMNDR
jgi:uncharacterized protein YdeI (YjbR/CyaY-like superfamily)